MLARMNGCFGLRVLNLSVVVLSGLGKLDAFWRLFSFFLDRYLGIILQGLERRLGRVTDVGGLSYGFITFLFMSIQPPQWFEIDELTCSWEPDRNKKKSITKRLISGKKQRCSKPPPNSDLIQQKIYDNFLTIHRN